MRNSRFDSAGTNSLYMMLLLSKKAINIVLTFASNSFWVALKTVNAIPSIAAWIPIELVAPSLIPCEDCLQKGWILIWRVRTSFCFPAWRASWKVHVLQTWRQSKRVWQRFCDRFLRRPLLTDSRSFMTVAKSVLWRLAIILKANKVNLFVSSVLFVFLYHSPNFLDTPRSYVATILVLPLSISNFAATRSVFVISENCWPLLPFLCS